MSNRNFEPIRRVTVPELDLLLGKPFDVLDDGFVRLVDYFGDESSICQAARVSYGQGTKKVSEDKGLIRYLMRHRHTTPLEMCEIKLHIRIPMDAWRQMVRHRTANINEYSTRYSLAIDDRQTTDRNEWRLQSIDNKQGSNGFLHPDMGEILSDREKWFHDEAQKLYDERINLGIAREQARKDLPLSTYTEAYWKCDLHNLLHFLALRMDSHAQKEIRDYATVIGEEIVSKWVPNVWEAFKEYRLNACNLSQNEMKMLGYFMNYFSEGSWDCYINELAKKLGWMDKSDNWNWKNRELNEFSEKLTKMGIVEAPFWF